MRDKLMRNKLMNYLRTNLLALVQFIPLPVRLLGRLSLVALTLFSFIFSLAGCSSQPSEQSVLNSSEYRDLVGSNMGFAAEYHLCEYNFQTAPKLSEKLEKIVDYYNLSNNELTELERVKLQDYYKQRETGLNTKVCQNYLPISAEMLTKSNLEFERKLAAAKESDNNEISLNTKVTIIRLLF